MDTVNNPINKIFELWREQVQKITGEGNCSMDISQTVFKGNSYAMLRLMGIPTASSDLDGNECAIMPAIQIDLYTNGSKALSKLYDLDSVSHGAMVSMRFRRTYGPSLVDNADNSIKRLTSRYERILGGGDSL